MSFKQNKSQETAIKTISGPVIIVSCPGSGKTTTLIRRIHHMIESGIPPAEILMVTFSRAAAIEMKEKYEKFFGTNPGISFQTIHSLCFNLLIREGKYTKGDVLSDADKMDFLVESIKAYPEADGDLWELATSVSTEITSFKNNHDNINLYTPENIDEDVFRSIYRKYEKWKESIKKIDFDDMLIQCRKMFEEEPAIKTKWSKHFRYIQCDEYQDTNTIQRDILYMLSSETRNLCVVGDDDQSIYRFRGARPEIMLHFMDDFPDAKMIMMDTNYRSAGEIVEKAGKLIQKNKIRYKKKFISQRGIDGASGYTEYIRCDTKQEEMKLLPKVIKELHNDGIAFNDMAILYRTNNQAILPVSVLSAEKIPFNVIDSVRCIYDGMIFKDIKTYVDLACGNYKDADEMHQKILSVLNKPNRFLDSKDFQNADYSLTGFRTAIYNLSKDAYWKYKQALEHIETWMKFFGPGTLSLEDDPLLVFKRLGGSNSIRYDKHMNDMAKFRRQDPDILFDELEELRSDAEKFTTIRDWFAHAERTSLFIKEETKNKNPDGVVLASMHKSKGLEWNSVFVIDCNDGIIPHKNTSETEQGVEEERRLFYVAMTRAKDNLYVINSSKNESIFIKESGLLTKEQIEEGKEIPKYLPGKKVSHKTFGTGKLVSYSPGYIMIDFKGKGRKKFPFPDAFKDGFLRYED